VLYTRGETVFGQGETGENCYVVVKGRVQGRIASDGTAEPVRFTAGPGAVIGEMTLMTGLPRSATVSVEEDVELLEISKAAFTRLLALRPEVPEILARLVAERAAANAAALSKTKGTVDLVPTLERGSILKRFPEPPRPQGVRRCAGHSTRYRMAGKSASRAPAALSAATWGASSPLSTKSCVSEPRAIFTPRDRHSATKAGSGTLP